MFTVVIAQKEHIDAVNEFNMFLSPLLDDKKFCFCEWIPEADTIHGAMPTLHECVGNREQWRAIIISDNGGLHYKNPFDRVNFIAPDLSPDDYPTKEYLEIMRKAKAGAYQKATANELSRLSNWLTDLPNRSHSEPFTAISTEATSD